MIKTRSDLRRCLREDSRNFSNQKPGLRMFIHNLLTTPGSNDDCIWCYIKTLRHYEFSFNSNRPIARLFYAFKLRRLGYKTGFQIPANTFQEGLTIYHWGPIIVNVYAKIGKNCTLHPNVVIGEKGNRDCPTIGDNVKIASGAFICGNITIGDNVIIGPNTVLTKSVPSNCTVIGNPAVIIKRDGTRTNIPL